MLFLKNWDSFAFGRTGVYNRRNGKTELPDEYRKRTQMANPIYVLVCSARMLVRP